MFGGFNSFMPAWPVQPASFTPSIDWFTVPDDGAELIDDEGNVWSRGPAVGAGFHLYKNGAIYTPPNTDISGWCLSIKIGDGDAPRRVYHENPPPASLGWIYEVGGQWAQPIPDPEGSPALPSNFAFTGSISNGSRTITCATQADADKIPDAWIAAGTAYVGIPVTLNRGNDDVGGGFPFRRYANAAAMNADVGNVPAGAHCALSDTKVVYIKDGGAWEPKGDYAGGRYYDALIVPRGYNAKIVEKDGLDLILDPEGEACQRTVSEVTMYVDVTAVARAHLEDVANGATLNWQDVFPGASQVPVCDQFGMSGKTNVTLTCDSEGSFEFWSPPGFPSVAFNLYNCTGCVWEKTDLRGNFDDNENLYGFGWATAHAALGYGWPTLTDDAFYGGGGLMRGPRWNLVGGCEMRDCTVRYANGGGLWLENSGTSGGRRVKGIAKTPVDYWQWFFVGYFCNDCYWIDCPVTGEDGPISGWEWYCSSDCVITRPVGINAYLSLNTCLRCRIGTDPAQPELGGGELRITENCLSALAWETPYIQRTTYFIDLGTNSGQWPGLPAEQNVIDGVSFIQEWYASDENDSVGGIHIGDNNIDCVVTNCYYEAPNYAAPSLNYGAQFLWSSGHDAGWDHGVQFGDNTVVGDAKNGGNIQASNIYAQGGIDLGGNVAGTISLG